MRPQRVLGDGETTYHQAIRGSACGLAERSFLNRAGRRAPVPSPSRVLSYPSQRGKALRYRQHASFARGKALRGALQELKEESEKRWEAAQCHVRDFCNQHKITMADTPDRLYTMSASWREEPGNGEEPFITRARVHDLVVMGRFTRPNGLPLNLLSFLLVECGRPMLIAAAQAPRRLGTIWSLGRMRASLRAPLPQRCHF